MKIIYNHLLVTLIFAFSFSNSFSQNENSLPYSFNKDINLIMSTVNMPEHNFAKDITDAEEFEKKGNYPRFAYHYQTDYTLQNSGTWNQLKEGGRVWLLHLKSQQALSIALFFDNFFLPEGSLLSVYSPDKKQHFTYDYQNNQGNNLFATEFVKGEDVILEYYEPQNVMNQGTMHITALSHQYRSVLADACEVNIVCSPEGTNWQDEKKGVCRIYVVEGTQAGYCSGSLINNTAYDCKRYILTAFHCGTGATTANFNQWVFRFNFEATQCTGQLDTFGANNALIGCTKKADSGDNGGTNGSDFLLLQLNSTATPSWWSNVYFNGWTRVTTAPTGGGVCIHHPNGDNKKISKFTSSPTSTYWQGGSPNNTHWLVTWVATTNGHGVTEGGSSGSPLFNSAGYIFGTLTGGGSTCSTPSSPDSFGKFSYHWSSNGTTADKRLQPWLDPNFSGVSSLGGSYSPCTHVNVNELTNQMGIFIFPNPSDGNYTLVMNENYTTDIKIKICNVIGQQVAAFSYSKIPDQTMNIDISNQSAGIYFIQIVTERGTITKKIIKQ